MYTQYMREGSRFALRGGLRPPFYYKCYMSHNLQEKSRNFREIGFPQEGRRFPTNVMCLIIYKINPAILQQIEKWKSFEKKNMEKIHFSILPKQNTFTKAEKLENCGNLIQKKPGDDKSRIYSVFYKYNI